MPTVKLVALNLVTVRHVPFMLMLSPSCASSRMLSQPEMIAVLLPSDVDSKELMAVGQSVG